MKQQINPAIAGVIIAVVVLIAGFFIWKSYAGTAPGSDTSKPPGMPADAAAEFQKRMGGASPTGPGSAGAPKSGTMMPSGPGGMTAPGGSTAPGGNR